MQASSPLGLIEGLSFLNSILRTFCSHCLFELCIICIIVIATTVILYKAIRWPNLGTHSWQFKTCLKKKKTNPYFRINL